MLTIICCYNNEDMFEKFVLNSLHNSISNHYLIKINNTSNRYNSMASAYNSVLQQVKTEWILFCHQDIRFESHFLSNLEKTLEKTEASVIGFAGIDADGIVYSNLKYSDTKRFITRNQLSSIKEVISIDECCFLAKKDELLKYGGFDEEICSGWHLYAVELCLKFRMNEGEIVCLPEELYHKNDDGIGLRIDSDFLRCIRKICKKYRKRYSMIFTPCYIIYTNPIKRDARILRTKTKQLITKLKEGIL